jgi:hypothetical protein
MNDLQVAAPTSLTGPLPLVIGITGHRDLRDADRADLEKQLGRILTDLRRRYPATPLLVLSSLAEGADRLAARVALACGAQLLAPLPLPRTNYEADFTSPPSQEEFAELASRAARCVELPLLPGNSPEAVRTPGPARNQQYALAGAYVARHSQILLALWDGEPSDREGGTAEVVDFKLNGVPPPFGPEPHPLDPVESGPVYQIVTPRVSNPSPVGQPLELRKRYSRTYESDKVAAAAFDRVYRRMDTFNRDALRMAGQLAAARDTSKAHLLEPDEIGALPPAQRTFLDWYTTADTLALHYQGYVWRLLGGLLLLVLVAAFFSNISDLLPDRLPARVGFVCSLGAAYALYLLARWGDFESRYLDYRALAEGLRVQLFWRLAGLPDSAADHYLRKQRSELDWIRDAIRVWTMSTAPEPVGRLPLVLQRWVNAQHRYYARAAPRDQQRLAFWQRAGKLFFLLGLAWGVSKLIPALAAIHRHIDNLGAPAPSGTLLHGIVVLISLAPIIAALLFFYAKTRGLSEHVKQYGRMGQMYAAAEQRLRELLERGNLAAAQALLCDLGKEALAENADWVQLHRDRPIQMPGEARSLR